MRIKKDNNLRRVGSFGDECTCVIPKPIEMKKTGDDEAEKDQWEACERIQQLREERGLKDMHEMQVWFIHRIHEFLMEHGRHMVGWDEIFEKRLAPHALIMCRYHAPA